MPNIKQLKPDAIVTPPEFPEHFKSNLGLLESHILTIREKYRLKKIKEDDLQTIRLLERNLNQITTLIKFIYAYYFDVSPSYNSLAFLHYDDLTLTTQLQEEFLEFNKDFNIYHLFNMHSIAEALLTKLEISIEEEPHPNEGMPLDSFSDKEAIEN